MTTSNEAEGQWYAFEQLKDSTDISLQIDEKLSANDKIKYVLNMLTEKENKNQSACNIENFHKKPIFKIEGSEAYASLKRSKGEFHEFEKNDNHKDKYKPEPVKMAPKV